MQLQTEIKKKRIFPKVEKLYIMPKQTVQKSHNRGPTFYCHAHRQWKC